MARASLCFFSVMIGLVLITCSLKQPQAPELSQAPKTTNPLIAFQLQYDEEDATYALHWPQQMVTGLSKSTGSDELLLVDYQHIRATMEIDILEYLSYSEEHLEGNESVRMPQEVYEAVKDELPAHGNDFDPIMRWEFVAGQITSFTASGTVAGSISMSPEHSRIVPALLDSLGTNYNGDGVDTSHPKSTNNCPVKPAGYCVQTSRKHRPCYRPTA